MKALPTIVWGESAYLGTMWYRGRDVVRIWRLAFSTSISANEMGSPQRKYLQCIFIHSLIHLLAGSNKIHHLWVAIEESADTIGLCSGRPTAQEMLQEQHMCRRTNRFLHPTPSEEYFDRSNRAMDWKYPKLWRIAFWLGLHLQPYRRRGWQRGDISGPNFEADIDDSWPLCTNLNVTTRNYLTVPLKWSFKTFPATNLQSNRHHRYFPSQL